MKDPAQNILDLTKPFLPVEWEWFTIFFMYGVEGHTEHFVEYGRSADDTDRNNLKNMGSGLVISELANSFIALRDKYTPDPLDKFTHIELTFRKGGEFTSVLGYGEPNLDVMPRGWPDDINAESYTYKNAWPNGMSEEIKPLLKDPRSLIGFD